MKNTPNLRTLAANAARSKAKLIRQQDILQGLTTELIKRIGTGGQTIQTTLGQVIVSAETQSRAGEGYLINFDADKFMELSPALQLELTQAGVVKTTKKQIAGQSPRVSFRLIG